MAKVGKPNRKRTTKGTPPPLEEASINLTKTTDRALRPLNFKVAADFKKDFKSYAMEKDISMRELLERSFAFFKERH